MFALVDEGVEAEAEFEFLIGVGKLGADVGEFGLGGGEFAGEGLGGVVAGFAGRETLADVGEAEDGFDGVDGFGWRCVRGWTGQGGELGGGAGGGTGEVEVGLEAEGVLDRGEGAAEGWLAEPAAEDGRGGPLVGGGAGGLEAEGA